MSSACRSTATRSTTVSVALLGSGARYCGQALLTWVGYHVTSQPDYGLEHARLSHVPPAHLPFSVEDVNWHLGREVGAATMSYWVDGGFLPTADPVTRQ